MHRIPKVAGRISFYGAGSDQRMITSINLNALDWVTNWQRRFGMIDTLYFMNPAPVHLVKGYR